MSSQASHGLVAVSSHGFGHWAQITPVLEATDRLIAQQDLPPIRWTIRTTLDHDQIQSRYPHPVTIDPVADDFGILMFDAMRVDLVQTLQQYKHLHQNWSAHVERVSQQLVTQQVDWVLADIPYLTLAGARAAGIPSLALCSLHWAIILEQLVQSDPKALQIAQVSSQTFEQILTQMHDAYASALAFLVPEPSMHMPRLPNLHSIGPICQQAAITQVSKRDRSHWSVLASLGGIPTSYSMADWPTHCLNKPIQYIVTPSQVDQHPNAVSASQLGLSFTQTFQQCDLVITKPGYGLFAESACAGKPVIYLARDDWPESQALITWLQQHGRALSYETQPLNSLLDTLLSEAPPTPVHPSGNEEAAQWVINRLVNPQNNNA